MKTLTAMTITFCAAMSTFAQGTLVYDQESSTDEISSFSTVPIQFYGTVGQSFTPSLSSIDFVRLRLRDATIGNSLGATLVVNVRSISMTGTVLGTSAPVAFTDGYNGATNFLFASSVSVLPDVTYFLEVLVQSGDNWGIKIRSDSAGDANYAGGVFYGGLTPFTGNDLWFREGIVVVPEPTLGSFLLIGIVGAVLLHRK